MLDEPTSEDLNVEAKRFVDTITDEVEERRNEREKQTIARNEKPSCERHSKP